MSKRFIGVAPDDDRARNRGNRDGGPQRRTGFGGAASGGSRYGLRFLVTKRGRIVAEIPADVALRQEPDALHRPRRRPGRHRRNRRAPARRPARPLRRQLLSSRSTAREVPIMDGSAAAFVDAIDEAGIRELSAAAQIHQGSEAGPRRGRRVLGRARAAFRLPSRRRDRFRDAAHRPPAPGASK